MIWKNDDGGYTIDALSDLQFAPENTPLTFHFESGHFKTATVGEVRRGALETTLMVASIIGDGLLRVTSNADLSYLQ